jgi:Zn-dependent peptidase ImmA (M78 family)
VKTLERGFKAWAERASLSIRQELGLSVEQPLPPAALADYLEVELWTPKDVPGITKDVLDELLKHDPFGWHALGLQVDGKSIVIYNPRKSAGRQVSDITHELAHIILDHQPATIIYSAELDLGMRSFDQKQEEEANCLAWCLLLPRESLAYAKRRRLSTTETAEHFRVSESLVTYRTNISGIGRQFRAGRVAKRSYP